MVFKLPLNKVNKDSQVGGVNKNKYMIFMSMITSVYFKKYIPDYLKNGINMLL